MFSYFYSFVCAFLITSVVAFFILFFCKKFDFFGKISLDKRKKICRIGGIAIISGFLAALFADPNLFISEKLWGVIVASFLILILGVSDDFFNFNWKTQLSFQIAISVLVFIFGLRIEYVSNPIGGMIFLNLGKYLIPSLIFTIFWIVLSINSMNWVDGVDGLSGGVALIGVVTIFFLSLKPEVNQPPIAIITMALAGAFLGFLVFNFYPSKILAGTSGSMFMGFILSILAIFAGTKIATALLILAIPIIDAIWVIWERIISGNSIFKRDNRHLHHKLMDLGWSQQKIALSFYAVTICIAFVALNTRAMGKLITMVSVFSVMTIFLIVINKKLKKTYFA